MDNPRQKLPSNRIVVEQRPAPEPESPIFDYIISIARDWRRYRDELKRAFSARWNAERFHKRGARDIGPSSRSIFLRHTDGSEEDLGIQISREAAEFLGKAADESRAEELASAFILLTLDDTVFNLRAALAPDKPPLEFAVGDDVAVFGENSSVSLVAYAGANAFRHAKNWESALNQDHTFDYNKLKQPKQAKWNIDILESVYTRGGYPVTEYPCTEAVRALADVDWSLWGFNGGLRQSGSNTNRDRYHARFLERLLSVASGACSQYNVDLAEFQNALNHAEESYPSFSLAVRAARHFGFIH